MRVLMYRIRGLDIRTVSGVTRKRGIKRGTVNKHVSKGIPWGRVSPVPASEY